MGRSDENFPAAIRQSNIHGNNRRALSIINGNIRRDPTNPSAVQKRGILTAKFAAQLAGKRQHPSVEKSTTSPWMTMMCLCLCNIQKLFSTKLIDAEVEMEKIDEDELVVDIDSCDKKNPLAVIEYIDDVCAHYKKTELKLCPTNQMDQQFDINERMRGILIDWLIEVHYKFELMEETLYLTVNIIDRFLSVQSVVRKKLQLVGVTAMLLACKYEEVSVPVVADLILISDKAYSSRQEVLDMEKLMINTLQFNLCANSIRVHETFPQSCSIQHKVGAALFLHYRAQPRSIRDAEVPTFIASISCNLYSSMHSQWV